MDPIFDEINLEKFIAANFGVDVRTRTTIVSKIPVGAGVSASVILSDKSQVYALVASRTPINLGDVRKIARRMNLVVAEFLPPHAQKNYFRDIAARKYSEVFPGRKVVSDAELSYYKTLASYNPAFALVREVRDGKIRQFDRDAVGGWRTAVRFAYRRITEIK